MIPRLKIDEILATARIEEVIGEFVHLKRAGKDYRALSPFTNEKTPSFYVVPDKQIFKDFSSGKGGTVVTFLMEHEHFTYPEALRWLANKYGIEIQDELPSEADKEEDRQRENLLRLNKTASEWFAHQMHQTDEGRSVGLGYFRSRQISDESIQHFTLGYCPGQGNAFTQHALQNGFDEEILVTSGLSKKRDDKLAYDAYRSRVIFPIHNLSGSVIAFGARILQKDTKAPKYINSPETSVYHKSKVLYGLYQAKNEIVRQDICYLAEGYTDVIALHQSGIRNCVASSGTALTREQIRLIKRYTPNITLIYDGDPAGIRASFRGIDLILEEGLNVRALLLPNGEDPDSFARNRSKSDLEAYFKSHVQDFISFKTNILSEEAGDDPIKKTNLIKEIVASIALIPDVVQRTMFIRQCSLLLNISEQVLLNSLNGVIRQRHKERLRKTWTGEEESVPQPPVVVPQEESRGEEDIQPLLERDLMRLTVRYGDHFIVSANHEEVQIAPFVLFELQRDNIRITDPLFSRLLDEIAKMVEKEEWEPRYLTHHAEYAISKMTVDLLTEKYHLDKWTIHEITVDQEDIKLERAIKEAIYTLKLHHIRQEIDSWQQILKNASTSGTEVEESVKEALRNINQLNRIKSNLSLAMGRIILG